MTDIADLMTPPPATGEIFGVTIGLVTNNEDPQKMGRVKVKFPWLSNRDESAWARVASPMAGNQRGFYALPEVNDEVLVAFEHGRVDCPYVLGALWNGKDRPPADNEGGNNNYRLMRSRSGHEILLDDTRNNERILVRDRDGKNTITIDTQHGSISLKSDQTIAIETQGDLTIKTANGHVEISGKTISLKAQSGFELTTDTGLGTVESQQGLAIKCMAGVKINDGALEVT